jgi:hypothetical protein
MFFKLVFFGETGFFGERGCAGAAACLGCPCISSWTSRTLGRLFLLEEFFFEGPCR